MQPHIPVALFLSPYIKNPIACCEWPAAWGVMLWDTNPAWPCAEDQSATTDHCGRFRKSKKLTLRERGDR